MRRKLLTLGEGARPAHLRAAEDVAEPPGANDHSFAFSGSITHANGSSYGNKQSILRRGSFAFSKYHGSFKWKGQSMDASER